jgi:protease I
LILATSTPWSSPAARPRPHTHLSSGDQVRQDFDRTGKPIAAICHAVQILITARLLKGKDATGWKSLVVDIEDAGAKYIDKPLVRSQQYIFSRQPTDVGFFCDAIINSLSPGESQKAAEMVQAT